MTSKEEKLISLWYNTFSLFMQISENKINQWCNISLSLLEMQAGDGDCTCGGKIMKGISVKPTKGDAVLFWSMVCFFNLSLYVSTQT